MIPINAHDDDFNPMHEIAQDARIKRGARMLATDRRLTKSEIDEVRADAEAFAARPGKSQRSISKALGRGFSVPVISDFINGKPNSRDEQIARQINDFIELEAARAQGVRPTPCVQTGVAMDIWTVCGHAAKHRTMGEVLGPAGVGKTMSAKACVHKIPGSIYIRCSESTAAPLAFLRTLARALRVGHTGTIDLLTTRIVEHLEGTGRLLLFDEAQKCSKRTLDVIRDLHDLAEIPIVLFGTQTLQKNIDDSNVFYGQFSSRIGVRLNLAERFAGGAGSGGKKKGADTRPLFTESEVIEALNLGASHLRLTPEAKAYLTLLAGVPGLGSLRLCNQVVRALESMKSYKTRAVTERTIRTALKDLHGIGLRDNIVRRVEQSQMRKTA